MQKIPAVLVLTTISLLGVACKTNRSAQNGSSSGQPYGGTYDPYASDGEYDNVYASGGGQSYEDASSYSGNASYGSDDYYNTASSNPYTAPSGGSSNAGGGGSGATSHTVQKGDTLYNISRRYGTTVGAIQRANGLDGDLIRIGERLAIP